MSATGTYDDLVARNVDFGIPKQDDDDDYLLSSGMATHRMMSIKRSLSDEESSEEAEEGDSQEGLLMEEEDRVMGAYELMKLLKHTTLASHMLLVVILGSVPARVYWLYMKAGGPVILSMLIILLFALTHGVRIMAGTIVNEREISQLLMAVDIWVAWWMESKLDLEKDMYIYIYAGIVGGNILILVLRYMQPWLVLFAFR